MVRDHLSEPKRFKDLRGSLEEISPKSLVDRLIKTRDELSTNSENLH